MRPRSRISVVLAAVAFAALCGTAITDAPASAETTSSRSESPLLAKQMAVLTDRGLSTARAGQALSLQGRVAETHLASRVEAALGDAFAGVWFEPLTAQFHVGVTSATSRDAAGRLVAQAALEDEVAYTRVRSTWAELITAQNEWNTKLAKLMARAEATTGIEAQRNAVAVTLSSSVSLRERTELEHETAAAKVTVLVAIASQPTLRLVPEAACEAPFAAKEAYCEKTLVSGVTIKTPGECTAGPMLVQGNETYMLTAGHCFGEGGAVGGNPIAETATSAYPTVAGQKEIGNEGRWYETKERDVAEVNIKRPGAFTAALPNPVPALVAEWTKSAAAPHAVEGVKAAEVVIPAQVLCHEGSKTGEQCGEVLALNVVVGGEKEHMVETNACSEGGDSGGPYFFRTPPAETDVLMVGTHIGKPAGTGGCPKTAASRTYFEPLLDVAGGAGFGILSTFPGQSLLTTATEVRPHRCRVLTWWIKAPGKEECTEPPGVSTELAQNLRESEDGAGTTPVSTNFPTSALAVNTKGKLRFTAKIAAVTLHNTCPQGYCFLGAKLESDPESSETVCRAATGSVPWADLQHTEPSAGFDDRSSWPFTVESDSTACKEAERGKVIIREASLLFETLGASKSPVLATGTFRGKYEQPGANCPAGGIKLETKQPGVTTEPEAEKETVEVDNGTTGEAAYLCFVSANNYVFPKEAPKWSLKEGEGIWKD